MRKFNHLTVLLALATLVLLGNMDTALAQNPTASPSPVNFSVQTGGTVPSQNVSITLNGASVTVQSVSSTTSSGQNWLLPSVGSSSVFVSINAAGLSAGTYSGAVTATTSGGQVSFPVNLTVSAAPTLSVSPSAVNFAYQTGTAAPLAQTISLTSSGGPANATVTSSTNSGGTQWLIVSPTGQLTTPAQITVNIQPANLAAGATYTGNIQINSASNGTVNIPVSLLVSSNAIISANPASLTFTAQAGGSATAQSLALSSSGSPINYTLASSVGSPANGSWLQVPATSGTTNSSLSISVNTAGLAVGTYVGAITVTAPNAGNGNLSIPVTLNITSGPVLQLSVPSLSFAYQIGQAQPQSQTVTVGSTSGQVGFSVAAQASSGQWLSVSPTSGTAPGNFVVSVNTTGLTSGTYNGTVTVTPSGSSSVPQTIAVTLVVSNSALLVLSPGAASFTATAGSSGTSVQNIAITSTDGTPLSFSVASSTTVGSNWLLINSITGTTPANLTISAAPAGLAIGTYAGTVTVSASGNVANSPQTIPVTLNVLSPNTLSSNPSSLSFTQSVNGSAPAPQTLAITSSGANSGAQITFAAAVSLNQGQGWLTVSPLNATTPANLTVTANGSGLAAGTYTGQIILSSPGVATQTVNVSLTVGGATGGFSSSGSMAHLASAGLWATTFTLVNNGTAAAQARLNFFDDNGNPLPLPLTFPQTSATPQTPVATLDRTIAPGAALVIQTTGPDSQTTQVGWAQLLSSGGVDGFAVFTQTVGARQQEAVVTVDVRTGGAYVLWFDNTTGFATGVALANISAQSANIPVIIRDDTGAVLRSDTITLPAHGHTSFNLAERFGGTSQRRGTVEFQTPAGGQISVLGLRFNPALAFSTIPALAK